MLPVSLNLSATPILLIGSTEAIAHRESQLLVAGATQITTLSSDQFNLATTTVSRYRLIMLADRNHPDAEALAEQTRQHNVLIWVEDRTDLCDFYLPAVVQRGDLTLSVSTNGKSPALAQIIRKRLENLFPEDWREHTATLGAIRNEMRSQNIPAKQIGETTRQRVQQEGWLQ